MPIEYKFDTDAEAAETWRRVALELANVAIWANAKGYEPRKAFPKRFRDHAQRAVDTWETAREHERWHKAGRKPKAEELVCNVCGADGLPIRENASLYVVGCSSPSCSNVWNVTV